MAKLPAFMFYPGDWLRETGLQMACASTRGIWINFLCHAWDAPKRGVIEGTADELCGLLRCSAAEFEQFLSDNKRFFFAEITVDVTNGHADVTHYRIVSRRLVRDEKARTDARVRQQRHRVTQMSQPEKCDMSHESHSTLSSSSSNSEIDLCSDVLSMNGASAAVAAPTPLTLKIESREAEPEKLTPEDLVLGWNEICVPAGLAKVISLDAIRRKKALERIRESHKHARAYGESPEDFWGHVFTNIAESPWCRGLRPSPGHERWRADFDFVIHDSTRPLKAREGKYV